MSNAISFGAIGFERWLCKAFRMVEPQITAPAIAEECKLFIEQEAVHSAVHAKHVRALMKRYPGLEETRQKSIDYFDVLLEERSLEFNICYGASLEATFTPSFKLIIDNRDVLMADGDARVASALLWHFCEEIEHRSSAIEVYNHVYKNPFRRLQILNWSKKHMSNFIRYMISDFKRHIPEDEWPKTKGQAFAQVSKSELNKALRRIFMSQTPWHNPAKEPTPKWAETWFSAYESGQDMTQFFGKKHIAPPKPVVPEQAAAAGQILSPAS